MLQSFNAVEGQSILDVCLNTYGNLDNLVKLMNDNDFGSVNDIPSSGQSFDFDNDFIDNQVINFSTRLNGSQLLSLISQRYATSISASAGGSQLILKNMYQATQPDFYTAGTDGETSIAMPLWIGWDLLAVEKEIQPLKLTSVAWNKSSGMLTLLSGLSLMKNETLYFLFQKMIIP